MWSNTFVDSTKAHGDSPLGLPDEILFRDIYRTQEILVPGFWLAFCIRMRHCIKLVRIGQKLNISQSFPLMRIAPPHPTRPPIIKKPNMYPKGQLAQ